MGGVVGVEVLVYLGRLLISSSLQNLDIPVKTYSAFAPPWESSRARLTLLFLLPAPAGNSLLQDPDPPAPSVAIMSMTLIGLGDGPEFSAG